MNPKRTLYLTILIASLGYFVDIYELLMFSIVRRPSLLALGVPDVSYEMLAASTKVINWQMVGLLLGGVFWGVMGDKKGRLSVLFGSILLYSIANFATGYVQTVDQYAWARFIGGLGLAGELGAGITLVSELMPRSKRGLGTSFVAGIGILGAVFAYYIYYFSQDWRLCYKVGGVLGILLLLLRVSIAESLLFQQARAHKGISRGNFFLFFTSWKRFQKYGLAILVGLPTWYVVGILLNFSNRFAEELYGTNAIDTSKATMLGYLGLAIGDITIGFVSQYFQSRKKAILVFYGLTLLACVLFFSSMNHSDQSMYWICMLLGFSTGYWALFVTMGAEHFGTNLRATAATTIPNMVRGALPLINMLFKDVGIGKFKLGFVQSGILTGIVVLSLAILANLRSEDTFQKEMDYHEES